MSKNVRMMMTPCLPKTLLMLRLAEIDDQVHDTLWDLCFVDVNLVSICSLRGLFARQGKHNTRKVFEYC